MPTSCSQCGASFAQDETCQNRFNASQLIEIEQPTYYAVHHLSVPCYMLQHNLYSLQGWMVAKELLDQFINHGLTPQTARKQYRDRSDNANRKWSITRGEKLPGFEQIAWSRTIADVRLDTPEHYCADVRSWAMSILADSESLTRGSEISR